MEPFIWLAIGFAAGAIVGAVVYGAKVRSDWAAAYDELEAVYQSCLDKMKAAYDSNTAEMKAAYRQSIAKLGADYIADLKTEYQRGKESDGVVRGAHGRMESVPARRYGDKVSASK